MYSWYKLEVKFFPQTQFISSSSSVVSLLFQLLSKIKINVVYWRCTVLDIECSGYWRLGVLWISSQ